jgi:hypothetical protein
MNEDQFQKTLFRLDTAFRIQDSQMALSLAPFVKTEFEPDLIKFLSFRLEVALRDFRETGGCRFPNCDLINCECGALTRQQPQAENAPQGMVK